MDKTIDCVVCGLATVDILARPVPLDQPISMCGLITAERIELTTGGLVSNSGIALARLGAKTAALAVVGDDPSGELVRRKYQAEGIDTSGLVAAAGGATSATIVLVDRTGDRSFIFDLGSAGQLDSVLFRQHRDLIARSKFLLFGYYALVPHWDEQLPAILAEARELGCQTALDAAGDGGGISPLDRILPHLDLYVPSLAEGKRQTGKSEPREIIDTYRRLGAPGIVGLKLGAAGALLSPAAGEYLEIAPVPPPGPVVDTTGAGDAFYAGLIAGLARGMPLPDAGRLAAAAGVILLGLLPRHLDLKTTVESALIVVWTVAVVASWAATIGGLYLARAGDAFTKGALLVSAVATLPGSVLLGQVLWELRWPQRTEPSMIKWTLLWVLIGPLLSAYSFAMLPTKPRERAWLRVRMVHLVTWGLCCAGAGVRALGV